MLASRNLKVSRVRSDGGPERLVLGLALVVPLALVFVVFFQLTGTTLAAPPTVSAADAGSAIVAKRPVAANPAPPPTLVPPSPEPPTAVANSPAAPPPKAGTYTVQQGDELKQIAADHQLSIWKLIEANDIPNPDSLKVGQVLEIPSE